MCVCECVCVFVYLCVCVCVYVCMYVCVEGVVNVCVRLSLCVLFKQIIMLMWSVGLHMKNDGGIAYQ